MSTASAAPGAAPTPDAASGPDHDAVRQAVLDAARAGDAARLGALLATHPAAAAAQDAAGDSAFMLAAYRGHRAAAELLAAHAPLDVFEATVAGDVARLAALLDADPALARLVRHDGWPALHFAGFWGMPDAAALLLDRGADVHAVSANATANTALHATLAISGHLPTAALLLARGADANARGGAGWRPLHLAASRGHVAALDLLLAHGADPAARADDGQDAAAIARARGHDAAAAHLARVGA
jgi:ankyrin repeat protein